MKTVEAIVEARWVIPVEPEGVVLDHHAVVTDKGRIVAVVPQEQARQTYQAGAITSLPHHALIPGLINAHTHTPMTLLRGLADDLPLMRWLNEHIWPAEQRWVSPKFVSDGTTAAIAEMIKGGITCFNDMYFFPDVIAQQAAQFGIRACVGLIMLDFPTIWGEGPDDYLTKGLRVHDEFRSHPLIRTAFAPHAPYTVSDDPLKRLRTLSDELDIPVHMHIHETAAEVEESEQKLGKRPLARLNGLGLVNPSLLAVHMTQLNDEEITLVADQGVHVLHCPESNLKLASGFCPAARLDAAGVNLALGTDGSASNNDLDMFGEMRTAALLAKGVAGDASALPAARVLQMATLNGARALGIADQTGSLVAGKWADMAAVDLHGVDRLPIYHPVSQLVYTAHRDHVTDVWIGGRHLLSQGTLTHMDESQIQSQMVDWGLRIAASDSELPRP